MGKIKSRKEEYDNSLESINELVQRLSNKETEISQIHEQATVLEKQIIDVQEKGEILRDEAKELLSQIKSWLKEYGTEYGYNCNEPKCVEIQKQILDIQKSIKRSEERALDKSIKALKKLEKSQKLTNEYNGLKEEYRQALQSKDEEVKEVEEVKEIDKVEEAEEK